MNRRTIVILVLAALVVAGAGTAFARIRPAAHHHLRVARPTHPPTPSPTSRPEHIASTAAPSNGHHMVTGADEPTERHVIHTTGSVGVVSGNISFGTNEHGAVGTPAPTR